MEKKLKRKISKTPMRKTKNLLKARPHQKMQLHLLKALNKQRLIQARMHPLRERLNQKMMRKKKNHPLMKKKKAAMIFQLFHRRSNLNNQ